MNHRFLYSGALVAGTDITLDKDQSHHLRQVLRITSGECVIAMDGAGTSAVCEVVEVSKKSVVLKVTSVKLVENPFSVIIALGITKAPALEIIFRKCTEIGVKAFQPLITQHSFSMDRWNTERWERVVQEAIKQCEAPFFPSIAAPLTLERWLAQRNQNTPLLFCNEQDRSLQATNTTFQKNAELLVGSEGGWSSAEIEAIQSKSPIHLSLGANRLRAETACLVGLVLTKRLVGEL